MNEKRNVIVVGKTGVGKSTVANCISPEKDENRPFLVSDDPASCTRRPKLYQCYFKQESKMYDVKLVDTVGLFDTGSFRNPEVVREIKDFAQTKIPEGVSIIFFVMKRGRFTKEEKDTFEFLISKFRAELCSISALIITHCDGMTMEARNDVVKNFRDAKNTQKIAEFMQRGIYTVGFPDLRKISEGFHSVYRQPIETDRECLRGIVCSSNSKMSLQWPTSLFKQDENHLQKGIALERNVAKQAKADQPEHENAAMQPMDMGVTEAVTIQPDPIHEASKTLHTTPPEHKEAAMQPEPNGATEAVAIQPDPIHEASKTLHTTPVPPEYKEAAMQPEPNGATEAVAIQPDPTRIALKNEKKKSFWQECAIL